MYRVVKHRFKRIPLLLGIILVVAMLIIVNLNRSSVYNELIALDLIPRPERLTELYFNNNANLPTSATRNQAVSFAFVIHNLETIDYQYFYNVSVNVDGERHIIDKGKVSMKNNQYYIKNEKFNLMASSGSQEIVIELVNKQQSIDFWMKGIAK